METSPPTNKSGIAPEYYTSEEARQLLRYDARKAFLDAVHREGVPHCRVNQRRLLFPKAALHAWLDRRSVGTAGRFVGGEEACK